MVNPNQLPNLLASLAGSGDVLVAPQAPAPDLGGSPDGGSLPPILPTPQGPMAPALQPKTGPGDVLKQIAPMILAMIAGRKDPLIGTAMLSGMTQGALAAQRERMAADQHAQTVLDQGFKFMQQTAQDVLRLKDPLARQQYLQYAHDIGVQHFGLPDDWTRQIPAHDSADDQIAGLKDELAKKLDAFDKDKRWQGVAGTPAEAKISFKLSNGQTVPVNKARALVGQAMYDSSGQLAYAPPPADKTKPVYRVGADKKTLEKIADLPANAQLVQEPQPTTRGTGAAGFGAPGSPDGSLDADGLAYAATLFRLTNQMPSLGMGKNPDRGRIINTAAAQAKALGQTPAAAIQRSALYKADAKSLDRINLLASTAQAAEAKASGQIDLIRGLSAKVPRTKFPILNRAILSGQTAIAGDPDATALINAISTFANEYGKIIEGSTGSVAGSSDAARNAAGRLVNAAMNPQQLARVLDLMQREMDLTLQGYDVTKNEISKRMGGQTQTPSPTATTPAPGQSFQVGRFSVQVGG